MTLDRRRRIRALPVYVSLLLACLATLGYGGIGPAAGASRLGEAFYYPSGNQLPD